MSIASGQGGVGGSVAYYLYLNGILEGIVNPVDAGNFEGNWAQPGVSSYSSVSGGGAASGAGGSSTTAPPVSRGVNPTDSGNVTLPSTSQQSAPTPATDSRSANPQPNTSSGGGIPSFSGKARSRSISFAGAPPRGAPTQSQAGTTNAPSVGQGYGTAQLGSRGGPSLSSGGFSSKVNMSL